MIPKDFITEWRASAPWVADRQVEQDLVISRALVDLFSRTEIANALAFRGGTALYKLHFRPAARYSEDIDLVQTEPGGIGPALDAIHDALDGWLGKPQWKQSEGRVTLNYRFESEDVPPARLKLKVEINSREHFTVYGLSKHRFEVRSRWFYGAADVHTYELDELLGTKLRALYQRKKGRDLFDLGLALKRSGVSPERILEVLRPIHERGGRAGHPRDVRAEPRREEDRRAFTADLTPLLASGQTWNFEDAFDSVWRELIARLPGEPWRCGG